MAAILSSKMLFVILIVQRNIGYWLISSKIWRKPGSFGRMFFLLQEGNSSLAVVSSSNDIANNRSKRLFCRSCKCRCKIQDFVLFCIP